MKLLLIAAGGFFGAVCRLFLSRRLNKAEGIPIGTLLANFIGCLLLGFLAGKAASGNMFALFGIGFTGALTTFSTFMIELVKEPIMHSRLKYLAVSMAGGIVLIYIGLLIGELL
ncbi:fluoride efflux transporter CrcB [Neobacillus piezotolerans]|uniref:Fluoride-specific ion channel FluC n=1 Tax=Neobacillus piezotolerans TaxID=2259171 RepID=A0A3D8GPS7_9BACI|nr:CrcB family protein [Neobacillus piezotolerans]RDU36490.1 fluoride efflux transporter CrcB [Neobacillus piezotolerans]